MPSNEEVVANLVAKLIADVAPYVKGMNEAAKETKKAAQTAEQGTKKIEDSVKQLNNLGHAFAEVKAAFAGFNVLAEPIKKFMEAEQASLQLKAVLESTGDEAEGLIKDYEDFAAAVQEVTIYDDDAVLSLLKVAAAFGVTGGAAQDAVMDAIQLSALTGESAEGLVRLTAAMRSGDTERAMMYARMIPQLRGVKDQAEFVTKYNELIAKGQAAAAAQAQSTAGRIKQLVNAYDNLKEEVGGVLAEALNPFVSILKQAVKWFAELDPGIKRFIIIVVAATVAAIAFWFAMNAGATLFNMLTGGVLIILGIVIAAAVAVGIWASQFDSLGEAVNQVKGFIQKIVDNWKLFLPHIAAVVNLVEMLWPILSELWDQLKGEGVGTWKEITDAVEEFKTEVEPILKALFDVQKAGWGVIGDIVKWYIRTVIDGFKWTFNFIKNGWLAILGIILWIHRQIWGESTTTWADIKNTILRVIYTVEFAIKNLERTWELAIAFIKWVGAAGFGWITHFATTVVPAAFKWMAENIGEIFSKVFDYLRQLFINFVNKMIDTLLQLNAIKNNPKLLDEIWRDLNPPPIVFNFKNGPFKWPERTPPPIEKQLFDELTAIKERYVSDLEDFIRDKGREPWWKRLMDGMKGDAGEVGAALADGVKDARKELEKFDAALLRSAEGISRLNQFRERIRYGPPIVGDKGGNSAGGGAGGPNDLGANAAAGFMMFENRAQPVPVMVKADDDINARAQTDLLRDIRDMAKADQNRNVLQVEFVNLEG